MSLRADCRAAAEALVTGYAATHYAGTGKGLNWYPGRPRTIRCPHAFVERISEGVAYTGPERYHRAPTVEVVLLHGLFDSKEAVTDADEFADGILDYVAERRDAAGPNATYGIASIEDDPSYVADWIPVSDNRTPSSQGPYFATRITFEGLALDQ